MIDSSPTFLECLIDVAENMSEIAAAIVEDLGAKGVEVRDETTMPPPGGKPVPAGRAHVLAWMDADADREKLSSALLASMDSAWRQAGKEDEAATKISFTTVEAEDWVQKVRDSVHPLRVGDRIFIRPSWATIDEKEKKDLVEIVLDPGLAFGTGHHATTFLCLEALEELLSREEEVQEGARVLDIGCGSGILAIAAALLGAETCVGLDNDPMAVKVAIKNVEDNRVSRQVTITSATPGSLHESFEIVVANIHLQPLTDMAQEIARLVGPNGSLLLSGLLESQATIATNVYARLGLMPVGMKQLDGWALVHMEPPKPTR